MLILKLIVNTIIIICLFLVIISLKRYGRIQQPLMCRITAALLFCEFVIWAILIFRLWHT